MLRDPDVLWDAHDQAMIPIGDKMSMAISFGVRQPSAAF